MFSLHHVALSVTNLPRSTDFYQQFGFRPVYDWRDPDDSLSIRHLKLGNIILELFCYRDSKPAPESTKSLATDLPRIGVKHFALGVSSISATRRELVERGILDPSTEITKGRTGILYFFISDPDGIFVEIVEDSR